MVDVKEAVKAASTYARDVLGPDVQQLALEEVEYDERKRKWLVTLGFSRGLRLEAPPTGYAAALAKLAAPEFLGREYKVFGIDAKTGEVRSMKIWK